MRKWLRKWLGIEAERQFSTDTRDTLDLARDRIRLLSDELKTLQKDMAVLNQQMSQTRSHASEAKKTALDSYTLATTVQRQLQAQGALGIDVGFHEPTVLILASKLNGGQIRFIHLPPLQNMRELQETVARLEQQYGVKHTIDLPHHLQTEWRRFPFSE